MAREKTEVQPDPAKINESEDAVAIAAKRKAEAAKRRDLTPEEIAEKRQRVQDERRALAEAEEAADAARAEERRLAAEAQMKAARG